MIGSLKCPICSIEFVLYMYRIFFTLIYFLKRNKKRCESDEIPVRNHMSHVLVKMKWLTISLALFTRKIIFFWRNQVIYKLGLRGLIKYVRHKKLCKPIKQFTRSTRAFLYLRNLACQNLNDIFLLGSKLNLFTDFNILFILDEV